MADEISVSLNVSVKKSNFRDSFAPPGIKFNLTGSSGGNPGKVNIGTTAEAISFGDVAPGLVVIQNLDTVNYVEFAADAAFGAANKLTKVSPGKYSFFELAAGATLYGKANTAAVDCLIKSYV